MQIFSVWLTVFSLSFTFLPMWAIRMIFYKRFWLKILFSSLQVHGAWLEEARYSGGLLVCQLCPSHVGVSFFWHREIPLFHFNLFRMSCWFKHGHLTTDKMAMFINGFNLVFFTFYTAAFAYYQPRRVFTSNGKSWTFWQFFTFQKYLYGQVASLLVTLFSIFSFVNKRPLDNQADLMGSIAAATQIASLAGGVYDLVRFVRNSFLVRIPFQKRAARLGTTEYIPASLQFGIFALTVQWSLFGFLVRNYYMMVCVLVISGDDNDQFPVSNSGRQFGRSGAEPCHLCHVSCLPAAHLDSSPSGRWRQREKWIVIDYLPK